MKIRTAMRGLAILLLFACSALPGHAASFSADLVDTQGERTRTGTFNFQDKSYRFEFSEGGQTMVILVDGQSGVMRLLVPAEKIYLEAGPDAPMNLVSNPFATYAHYARTKDVKAEGVEPVDGVPCTKQNVSGGEQLFVTAWLSEEFQFPLKVIVPLFDRTVELRNLKRGPQDSALFTVPADYKLHVPDMREPAPEWAGQIASAPVLVPPFEKTLSQGEIIRIDRQAGRPIKVEGTGAGGEDSAFTSVGFKDGRPTSDVSGNTMGLSPGQSCTMTLSQGPDEADDYVIRVREGKVKIRATLAGGGTTASGAPSGERPPGWPVEPGGLAQFLDSPGTVGVATRMEIFWNGPANNDDFISVARPEQAPGAYVNRTNVREGNPSKVWAPSDPGEYEVRYVLGRGSKLLAKIPLTITAAEASLEMSGAADVAAWIEVNWTGPATEGDFVSLARRDQPPGASVNRTPVKNGNPARVRAPSDPGEYEVRYILGRGNRLIMKTPITINPVTAKIEPPATAKAGVEFAVSWQGPGYPEDFVSLARTDQAPGASLNRVTVRQGNPVKIRAPKEPGIYEVRYVLGFGNKVLAKTTITIEVP
jgi:hypothetical protein